MNSRQKERIRPPLPEGPFLVVGMGRSGQAVARMLAAAGADVRGCDAGEPAGASDLAREGIEVSLSDQSEDLLEGVSTLVKSPGVPGTSSLISAALDRSIEVTGELELAWRSLPNRFCAVTGTNGKTTVTEMIGHIHRVAGMPVEVAGNVGKPVSSLVGRTDPQATVVCECSSFQLEDSSRFSPEVAVLLNLSPDHLDRHDSMEEYLGAKLKIFVNQMPGDTAVINARDPLLEEVQIPGDAEEVGFCGPGEAPSLRSVGCDAGVRNDWIIWQGEEVVEVADLPLPGGHNLSNAAAATAASAACGIALDQVAEGLRSFEGVAHRLEIVGEAEGVRYVNDSKATNVAAASAAIASFPTGVRVILGGSLKDESFEPLLEVVLERCAGCYLVGEAAASLDSALATARDHGVEVVTAEDFEEAVQRASDSAREGEVVLLAPACASFDLFENFEQRGNRFRELVERRIGG
jgi:UDP-N-acetylmuramoylalanine--D-glutamate ligase